MTAIGEALLRQGRTQEALEHFEHAHAHAFRAYALTNLGRRPEAETAYRQHLRHSPKDAGAWFNLGNVQRELGEADRARSSYEASIRLSPSWAAPCKPPPPQHHAVALQMQRAPLPTDTCSALPGRRARQMSTWV